jgi:hypothetical protein
MLRRQLRAIVLAYKITTQKDSFINNTMNWDE